jgi:hypothetical protein
VSDRVARKLKGGRGCERRELGERVRVAARDGLREPDGARGGRRRQLGDGGHAGQGLAPNLAPDGALGAQERPGDGARGFVLFVEALGPAAERRRRRGRHGPEAGLLVLGRRRRREEHLGRPEGRGDRVERQSAATIKKEAVDGRVVGPRADHGVEVDGVDIQARQARRAAHCGHLAPRRPLDVEGRDAAGRLGLLGVQVEVVVEHVLEVRVLRGVGW